jgi:AraC-like DNA-binding protein
VLGELLGHCPTVRSSIAEASNYAHLVLPMAGLHLTESDAGDEARLVLELPFTEPRMLRTTTELALGFAVRVGRRYAPLAEGPSEVAVAYPRPRHGHAYSELLRCPVRFDAARTQIVFPAARLDEPQLFLDDGLFCLLKVRADQQLAHTRTNLQMHERVRHVLRHQVDLSHVTPGAVARRLGVTPRRLRCCLALEGHSLQELVDETRREISLREILDSPIKGLADRVGFSQVGTFFRAFKRWTGTTPGRYRSQAATARLR